MVRTHYKNYIRAWRKHRDVTLEEMAERLHVSHSTLSRVERGLQPYSQPLLERLAEELQTDPASLLMRDPSDPEGIWSVWETLSPPQRRQAVALIHALKSTGTNG
jgi:transcriptional regulator with XRE-family HTH domain